MREFVYYSKSGVTAGNLIKDDLMKAGRTLTQSFYDWGAHRLCRWGAHANSRMGGSATLGTWLFRGGFIV